MNLGFDIADLSRAGRKSAPIEAVVARPLRQADFVLLSECRSVAPIPIERITERHHAAARLTAQGLKPGEIAAILGYTVARLSNLRRDKAFQDLVELYMDTKEAEFVEVNARMAGISKDALVLIQERLEEDHENISLKELRETAVVFADRTGHGPTSSQVNINVTADMGDRLEKARARAKAAALGDVIDITPEVT